MPRSCPAWPSPSLPSPSPSPDYHQLTDEPQYIDFAKMARVASLVKETAVAVADLDHRVVVDKPKPDPEGVCKQ